MPLNATVSPLVSNRKAGISLTSAAPGSKPTQSQYQDWLSVQNAVNDIYNQLSQSPTLEQLTVQDPFGNVVAQIGDFYVGSNYYPGAAFSNVWIGPNADPLTAPFFSDGTHVVIGKNGVVEVQDLGGNVGATLGVSQEAPLTITATSNGTPDVLTVPGNTYVNGDTLFIAGATGDTNINGYRIVENVGTGGAGTFTTTDLTGAAVNGNGALGGTPTSVRYYAGILAQTFAIGQSFANYKLRAFADGTLSINNATITLTGSLGSITIDPSSLTITSLDTSGNEAQMGDARFSAIASGGRPEAILDYHGLTLYNTFGAVALLNLGSAGAAPTLKLSSAAGSTVITLDPAATSVISVTGDINTTSKYRLNGVAGLGVTRNMVASVSTAANGVFGTPGAGQSNGTVVTGVTLTASTFSGGILTA